MRSSRTSCESKEMNVPRLPLEAEVGQVGDGLSEMREKDTQTIYLITTKLSVVSKMRDKHRCDE